MRILRIRLFSKQDICCAAQVPHDPENITIIFYFKLSPCCECCILSFGVIPRRLNCMCRRFETLSVPSSKVMFTRPMKMEECSETSEHKTQTPGNHPKGKNTTVPSCSSIANFSNIIRVSFGDSFRSFLLGYLRKCFLLRKLSTSLGLFQVIVEKHKM